MAKRPPGWQPSLDLGLPASKREREESRVEYDPKPKTRDSEPVIRREPSKNDPWWDRVQKVAENPRAPNPVISFANSWRGLLREEGWTSELPAAHGAMLEATVRGLEVRPGVVEAGIGVARERPQRVQLRLVPFSPAEWARVVRGIVDAGAAEALLADLDAGRVPMALLDACDAAGMTLAPKRLALVVAACTCGGARLPCDHVLGTHLALARRLGAEPLSLVTFRGAPPEELRALVDRIREEAARTQGEKTAVVSDPYAFAAPLAVDWSLLDGTPPARPPLPPIEGWRATETFDALARRLLAPARAARRPRNP